MVAGDAKRVVVIRNISSNFIEEAILILKNEPDSAEDGAAPENGSHKRRIDNEFLYREAEAIINNYVQENNLKLVKDRRNIKGRKGRLGMLRRKPLVNALINIMLLGSIILLIYIACKLI